MSARQESNPGEGEATHLEALTWLNGISSGTKYSTVRHHFTSVFSAQFREDAS